MPAITRSSEPLSAAPRADVTGSFESICDSVKPRGVHLARTVTPESVKSMVPCESVLTGSVASSTLTVQPSAVSGIESAPNVPT